MVRLRFKYNLFLVLSLYLSLHVNAQVNSAEEESIFWSPSGVASAAGVGGGTIYMTSGAVDNLNVSNTKFELPEKVILDPKLAASKLDKNIQAALEKISQNHLVYIEAEHIEKMVNFEERLIEVSGKLNKARSEADKIYSDIDKLKDNPSNSQIKLEFDKKYGGGAAQKVITGNQSAVLKKYLEKIEGLEKAYNQLSYEKSIYGSKEQVVKSSFVIDPTKEKNVLSAVEKQLNQIKLEGKKVVSIGITEVAVGGTKKIIFGGLIAGGGLMIPAVVAIGEAVNNYRAADKITSGAKESSRRQ